MKADSIIINTLKEDPIDAEIISHKLMLRAGLIQKLSSGIYTWMPLGFIVLQRVICIIRANMSNINAQELLMPSIQPARIWEQSNRFEQYGPLMLKMEDRHHNKYCFGPTHEEVISCHIKKVLLSYKQLPINVYQIQTKFRDELRPRSGVIRAREFTMKDAYSFHASTDSLDQTYKLYHKAYETILNILDIEYLIVGADSGEIGGSGSQEFHAICNIGEDKLAYTESGSAYNIEVASCIYPKEPETAAKELELVHTPNISDFDSLAPEFPNMKLVKSLAVYAKDKYYLILLASNRSLNIIKTSKVLGSDLRFASESELSCDFKSCAGYLGPINISKKIEIVVDYSAKEYSNFVAGANKKDYHYKNINWSRDLADRTLRFEDLSNVLDGDISNEGKISICNGIELAHIFKLGNKYSKAFDIVYSDNQAKRIHALMGCYGFGVSRSIAAIIEQHHDDQGIIWPESMSPFTAHILCLDQDPETIDLAQSLHDALESNQAISVLLDTRDESIGRKFYDADLIGIPHRIICSKKNTSLDRIKYIHRARKDQEISISLEDAPAKLTNILLDGISV